MPNVAKTPKLDEMRVCQVFTLLLVLWDGRPGLTRAETPVIKVLKGGDITVSCFFYFYGNWKIFCKNDCEKREDILVEGFLYRQQNGRYSIKYEERYLFPNMMHVTIHRVSQSDAGRYKCGLKKLTERTYEFVEFEIKVTNAATPLDGVFTPRPAVTTFYQVITTRQRRISSSPFEDQQQNTLALTGSPLYVGLTLTAVVILFSTALFIFCRKKRRNKPKVASLPAEPPEASGYAQIPESNCVYEEIPDENSQSRPHPVEISTVSVSATFRNTTEQTSDIYSLASEPSGQLQTEEASSNITYSELDFSKIHSASRGQTKSVPQVQSDTLGPLYSTVAFSQR